MELEAWLPEGDDWRSLHDLLDPLWESSPEEAAKRTLALFERFPEHDGWGVLKEFAERLPQVQGFEELLLESLRRSPSRMTIDTLDVARRAGNERLRRRDVHDLLSKIVDSQERTGVIAQARSALDLSDADLSLID